MKLVDSIESSSILRCSKPTHNNFRDLTHCRFGRLKVIEFIGKTCGTPNPKFIWKCLCDCGLEILARGSNLVSGNTSSCGCFQSEIAAKRLFKHGMRRSPEWLVWAGMRRRCEDPSNKSFKNYGGRGIFVCERWQEFSQFFQDMGIRPSPLHSIERKDNSGNYCPENCIWATRLQQARNKTTTRYVTAFGVTKCLSEWAQQYGVDRRLIFKRLKLGWDGERAVSTSPRQRKSS